MFNTVKKDEHRKPVNLLQMHGNAKWHEACKEVYQLVRAEPGINPLGQTVDFKPVPERQAVYQLLVGKYIQYIKSFQRLCECLRWLVHPQKRALLKRCIEAVAGRIGEIKLEMISVDRSLFNYFDDILFDMGLTPDDLKMPQPKYLLKERYNVLHMRERLLSLMIERMKSLEHPEVDDIMCNVQQSKSATPEEPSDGAEEILISYSTQTPRYPEPICRQQEITVLTHPSMFIMRVMDTFDTNPKVRRSILLLQSCWRGWLSRRHFIRKKEEEEIALGMRWPRDINDVESKDDADYEKREEMWRERDEELQISKAIEHERFRAVHGHNMAWELKYNITQWLLELRDLQGSFPDYPDEEEGGCERLFAMKTTEEVEKEIEDMINPPQQIPAKEDKKEQQKKVVAEPEGWKPAPTATVPILIKALTEYNDYWYLKEELDNVEQKFDRQIMLEQVRQEAGKQIRLQVDELMRYELDKLRCGIELIETDKPKAKKEGKNEVKEKVTKDPLAHKSVEELYGELVLKGIVIPVRKVNFSDILGDYNFLDSAQAECIPTMADIKTLLTHLVVFPLTSEFIHSVLPLTNRLLLAGSSGTGKTMLIHALAREVGANLMDISPDVLAGKYEGPEQQEYLMNALLKVGKSMEPTIFMIDSCEILFTKAPPGTAATGQDRPQRWANVFSKMMDKMKKGDRMFLIGETTDPFTCNNYALCEMFKNIIYIPRPDYGNRVMLWREFLARMPICRSSCSLNPSILSQFSEGYSPLEIERAVNETLTMKRLHRFKPVSNMEFLMALTLDEESLPLDQDDVEAWTRWYASTPLMRKRREMLGQERAAEELLGAT